MSTEDLDIDDLAVYLHLTPAQVRKMADRGKLPGRRVSGEWRFSQAEIHDWFERQIGASTKEELEEMQPAVDRWSEQKSDSVSLGELLRLEAIEIPLGARTGSAVVRRMCELAADTGLLWEPTKMMEAVQAREQLHTTALDIGVAFLHPRRPQPSNLAEPLLALGISSNPLPFGNESGRLTDVFFLICSTDDRMHLQVLAKLSRLLAADGFLSELRSCECATEAHKLVVQYDATLE